MSNLSFDAAPLPIRDDIAEALPQVWTRIGQPGTWLTARERVAIAAECRNARHCRLCAERKRRCRPTPCKANTILSATCPMTRSNSSIG